MVRTVCLGEVGFHLRVPAQDGVVAVAVWWINLRRSWGASSREAARYAFHQVPRFSHSKTPISYVLIPCHVSYTLWMRFFKSAVQNPIFKTNPSFIHFPFFFFFFLSHFSKNIRIFLLEKYRSILFFFSITIFCSLKQKIQKPCFKKGVCFYFLCFSYCKKPFFLEQ